MVPQRTILRGAEARNALVRGAGKLADFVRDTLGPFGSNVFLEKGRKITNDGAYAAREVQLENEIEALGAGAVREAAEKTNNEVGDGTTTATTLAYAIVKEAVRHLGDDTKGIIGKKTPSEVVRQIEKERQEVTDKLLAMATPIDTEEKLIKSALVSVEDEDMAQLIGHTQWELGKEGVIISEETAERTSSIEKVKGLRIDNGFGTAMLINNQEKQTLEISDAHVILTSHTIKGESTRDKDGRPLVQPLKQIQGLIEQMVRSGAKKIAVIARAWSSEAISLCQQNIQQGAVHIYPLQAPYEDMDERMKDLAAVTGATYYGVENSNLEDMMVSDVGFAKRIVARRYDAVIARSEGASLRNELVRSLSIT